MKFSITIILVTLVYNIIYAQNIELHYNVKQSVQLNVGEGKTKQFNLDYEGVIYKNDTTAISFIKPLYFDEYPNGRITIQTSENATVMMPLDMDTIQRINLYNLKLNKLYSYDNKSSVCNIYNYYQWKMKWRILPETKEINGLQCKHAVTYNGGDTTKVLFEIWYTPDIEMEFGLLHLKNAPGLVVEGNFPMMNFSYTLKYFKKDEPINSSVFWPKEFNKVKFEDYSTPQTKTEKDKKKEAINNQ